MMYYSVMTQANSEKEIPSAIPSLIPSPIPSLPLSLLNNTSFSTLLLLSLSLKPKRNWQNCSRSAQTNNK